MTGRVSIGGQEMDIQEAMAYMEEQLATARVAAALPIAEQLNKTMREVESGAQAKPDYTLVGTVPEFDGEKPGTVVRFFQSLDDVGELSNWGQDEKLRVAKLKIKGSALRFVTGEDQTHLRSYDEFKRRVIERFSDKAPTQLYYQQLSAIQQKRDEAIEAFADRVKVLNEKTVRVTDNPDVNRALREEGDRRALEAFLRGLAGNVGEQTRLKFPTSLREAVNTAIAIEHLGNTSRPIAMHRKVFHTDVTCFNCHKRGHVSRECRTKNPRRDHNVENLICWRCRKPGHLQRDCRVRLSPSGPRSGNEAGVSGNADTTPRV